MPKSASGSESDDYVVRRRRPPARTRERRVQQLVSMAEELVEERMLDKTASPTELVSILRLGTAREIADVERIRMQTKYLEAQEAKARSETVREELFTEAMEAMTRYQGGER